MAVVELALLAAVPVTGVASTPARPPEDEAPAAVPLLAAAVGIDWS